MTMSTISFLQFAARSGLYAWDPFDRAVIGEQAQDVSRSDSRALVKWDENFRTRARVFVLSGPGGYMPSTTAHLVENGPDPSITISFTYYTDSTRVAELLYRGTRGCDAWGSRRRPWVRVAPAILFGSTPDGYFKGTFHDASPARIRRQRYGSAIGRRDWRASFHATSQSCAP